MTKAIILALKAMMNKNIRKIVISVIGVIFFFLLCIAYFISHPVEALIDLAKVIAVKPTLTEEAFITRIAEPSQTIYNESGILPSITIAQAALESGWGKTAPGNNLFGIKAYNWTGPTIQLLTNEEINGVTVTIMASFRAYSSWDESIEDHKNFLISNITYIDHGVFSANNFMEQAQALQAAGYATDSQYALKLCTLVKEYNLDKYDTKVQ